MTRQVACGDVVEGCSWTASAPTEKELLEKVVVDAAEKHGVQEVTPELAAKGEVRDPGPLMPEPTAATLG